MEMAGIETLPPECGVPTVRRELIRSSDSGEIVVAGALGLMLNENGASGIDLESINGRLQAMSNEIAMKQSRPVRKTAGYKI
jgi:hypothetical protein